MTDMTDIGQVWQQYREARFLTNAGKLASCFTMSVDSSTLHEMRSGPRSSRALLADSSKKNVVYVYEEDMHFYVAYSVELNLALKLMRAKMTIMRREIKEKLKDMNADDLFRELPVHLFNSEQWNELLLFAEKHKMVGENDRIRHTFWSVDNSFYLSQLMLHSSNLRNAAISSRTQPAQLCFFLEAMKTNPLQLFMMLYDRVRICVSVPAVEMLETLRLQDFEQCKKMDCKLMVLASKRFREAEELLKVPSRLNLLQLYDEKNLAVLWMLTRQMLFVRDRQVFDLQWLRYDVGAVFDEFVRSFCGLPADTHHQVNFHLTLLLSTDHDTFEDMTNIEKYGGRT